VWAPTIPVEWPQVDEPQFVPMVHVWVLATLPNGAWTHRDPALAAADAWGQVDALRDLFGTSANIAVQLKDFGRDGRDQDYQVVPTGPDKGQYVLDPETLRPIPTNWEYDTRFFRIADRLPPPFSDENFTVKPRNSPNDFDTARTFRHPFLKNADPGFDTGTGSWKSPMKQWLQEFVNAYNAIPGSVPPARLYFDTESIIAQPPGENPVYMLAWLADPANGYWNTTDPTRKVPEVGVAPENW
jgi:hypothetical protein